MTTDTDRLAVVEALELAGWTGDDDNPLGLLRRNGAVWAVHNDCGDSSLSRGTWTVEFASDVPTVVIVAACRAAAEADR